MKKNETRKSRGRRHREEDKGGDKENMKKKQTKSAR
jgi:hypothetical protein